VIVVRVLMMPVVLCFLVVLTILEKIAEKLGWGLR